MISNVLTALFAFLCVQLTVQQQFPQQFGNQCYALANIDYYGNDLPCGPLLASSSDQCCALCQQNPQCFAWTFLCNQANPQCSTCYLKSCVGSDIRCTPNTFSGVKQLTTTTNCPTTTTQRALCYYLFYC